MDTDKGRERLKGLWNRLYPGENAIRDALIGFLENARRKLPAGSGLPFDPSGLVYSCYGDAFAVPGAGNSGQPGVSPEPLDFLAEEFDRLKTLGVRTLWLLPLLRSPGRDEGFDVSDYGAVDPRFGGNPALARLLARARKAGILVIFDIAINHTSDTHPWFTSARADRGSPYRSWFHWSNNNAGYAGASHIFKGMVDSNWTWSEKAGQFYLHRFYPFQPDLNYGEPAVTAEMVRVLTAWRLAGVEGFRLDAAPMLWKAEGTTCESLPETHLILKIFRASLAILGGETLLLAEANQPAPVLRGYFGDGDECHAAFHFPLLPLLWTALVREDPGVLADAHFPRIPPGCAWFTFLRCHDELTLDLLPVSDRKEVLGTLCRNPAWGFRGGQGVSGRLFELLGRDPDWTVLAFSVLLSLPGTPVLYYGDEIASTNNEQFMAVKARATGFPDSRFLHRGPFDRERAARAALVPGSAEGRVLSGLQGVLDTRTVVPGLAAAEPTLAVEGPVLVSERRASGRLLRALSNLSGRQASARGRTLGPHACIWEIE
jgi:maltose alpha-D-glucosyltransferase/alpha-amylase